MATDLVSEIVEVLSPTISSRIASALGLDPAATQKAIAVAVPAILSALISYVSKAQGANKLNEVVRKQEPGMLTSLASVIGEPGQKALIDQGASVLTSLLGGKTFSSLSEAVGQYAGIGQGGSKSLLGLLGPVMLGVLGKEQSDRGLDASGLGNLLISQKNNVSAALPAGFSRYLSEAGIPDDVIDSRARVASRPPASTPPSIWPWLLGALALLALGALAWHLLQGRHKQIAETANPKIEGQVTAPAEAPYAGLFAKLKGVKVGDVDVGELSITAVNDLYTSLQGINDEATAQSSMPGLTKASSEFDRLTGVLNQLSPETRKTLAELFASIRPNLDQLLDKALAIPGVGPIIKPTVDAIRAKLETLTKA
jgi:Bacterial protein of unknown function (DUF937)